MEATLRGLMATPRALRHVAVVGARGHGKTALVAAAGGAVERQHDDHRRSSPTITPIVYPSSPTSTDDHSHLVQLIDTPGTLDDIMEIYAALTLADGVVVVVDPLEGVGLLVEKAVEKAVARHKKPMLVLNSGQAQPRPLASWYDACVVVIESVNGIIERTCVDGMAFEEWKMDGARGNVVVGSAVFGWGFVFPKRPDELTFTKPSLMMGPDQYDVESVGTDSLWQDVCSDHSFGQSVLNAIVGCIPSPTEAFQTLPRAHADAEWLDAIRRCDVNGPLIVHVVRLVPTTSDPHELLAIGRVLSGTVRAGQTKSVITPTKSNTTRHHVQADMTQIGSVGFTSGHELDVPAGNLCQLRGIGNFINKYGVVTTCEQPKTILASSFFRRLTREATPPSIVRATVLLDDESDTPTLLTTLHCLLHTDLASEHYETKSGEVVLTGISPAHLKRSLALLGSSRLHERVSYAISEPFPFFQETVTTRSSHTIMAKSRNRYIRLICKARPLRDAGDRVLSSSGYLSDDANDLVAPSTGSHDSSEQPVRRILVDPSSDAGPNMLVDCQREPSRAWLFLKANVSLGFSIAVRSGVLCGERVVGLHVDLEETAALGDSVRHVNIGQALWATRAAVFASQLVSSPALLEAFVLVEIHWRDDIVDCKRLCELVAEKRGRVVFQDDDKSKLRASVPTRSIWGLEQTIKQVVGHSVVVDMILSHYERVDGDPLDPASQAGAIVHDLRVRKGDTREIQALSELPAELLS